MSTVSYHEAVARCPTPIYHETHRYCLSCPWTGKGPLEAIKATGAELIAAERRRQVEEEGWTAEHDAQHADGELVGAAICYAKAGGGFAVAHSADWPWDWSWWKPSHDPVRNLVKAGALIAVEIDRLQREVDTLSELRELRAEAGAIPLGFGSREAMNEARRAFYDAAFNATPTLLDVAEAAQAQHFERSDRRGWCRCGHGDECPIFAALAKLTEADHE